MPHVQVCSQAKTPARATARRLDLCKLQLFQEAEDPEVTLFFMMTALHWLDTVAWISANVSELLELHLVAQGARAMISRCNNRLSREGGMQIQIQWGMYWGMPQFCSLAVELVKS